MITANQLKQRSGMELRVRPKAPLKCRNTEGNCKYVWLPTRFGIRFGRFRKTSHPGLFMFETSFSNPTPYEGKSEVCFVNIRIGSANQNDYSLKKSYL